MDKVQVFLDGVQVDISGYEMPFEFINPLFSDNHFNSSYSFDHVLPWSSKNKAAFNHINRLDGKRKDSYAYSLVISGVLFFKGVAKVTSSNNKELNISVISDGIDFVQTAEKIDLSALSLDEVEVFDDSILYWADKLTAWKDHLTEVMSLDPKEGTHKFPMIFTNGYDGNGDKSNKVRARNYNAINVFVEEDFQINFPIQYNQESQLTDWPYMVAPCPRIEYLIERICADFQISKRIGAMWNEQEFLQMWLFAGTVADEIEKFEVAGDKFYVNVHGQRYDLRDYVPKASVLDIFNMLWETFGATFYLNAGVLRVRTAKELLAGKPVVIKPSATDIPLEYNGTGPLKVVYSNYEDGVFLALVDKLVDSLLRIPANLPLIPSEYVDAWTERYIDVGTPVLMSSEEVLDTYELKHYPMPSTFFPINGMIQDAAAVDDFNITMINGWGEFAPRHMYSQSISGAKSDRSNKADKIVIGLLRGVYETFSFEIVSGSAGFPTFRNTHWSYSHARTIWHEDSLNVPVVHEFGNSLYLNMQNGTWDTWLKYFFLGIGAYDTFVVPVNEPIHKIRKMAEFDQVKAIIETKRGNIGAILYKITGTVTEKGLEGVQYHYRVPKSVLSKGDFNPDFSVDFY